MSEQKQRKRKREYLCSLCGDKPIVCWACQCMFRCMEENQWD